MTGLVKKYFEDHPECKKLVIEKSKILFREDYRKTHHYEYLSGETKCWVCGEKWGIQNITVCTGFEKRHGLTNSISISEHIKSVLKNEEQLYRETIKRCETLVRKKYSSIQEISGKEMVILHTTNGCDPETLEGIFNDSISRKQREEYEVGMEEERSLSRSKQIKEVITAVNDNGSIPLSPTNL